MTDDRCANCGKYLSPAWRDKCQHCGVAMSVARPIPQELTANFRGVSREDAQSQAAADASAKRALGYELAGQEWGEDGGIATLNVRYRHTGTVVAPAVIQGGAGAPVPAQPRRGGLFGWRKATWAIWIWTIAMAAWAVGGVGGLRPQATEAGQVGQAIGAGLAVAFIFGIWFVGFTVLSVIWFATRPQRQ